MRSGGADLHAHTTCSDGRLSPERLVETAAHAGLQAIAITDHDTTDGIAPALRAALPRDIEVVAGIEISSCARGREMHLLGLFVDPRAGRLAQLAGLQLSRRRERAEHMVVRARGLGMELTMDQIDETAGGAPIGRPHVARALVRSGAVRSIDDAFRCFLAVGRPGFVPKALPAAAVAIETIHGAGGVAVVAHPGSSRIRDALLAELAAAGLDGIEVRHPSHGAQRERILLDACERLGLLPSGGSDYHGPGTGTPELGEVRVSTAWLSALRERAAERRERNAQ